MHVCVYPIGQTIEAVSISAGIASESPRVCASVLKPIIASIKWTLHEMSRFLSFMQKMILSEVNEFVERCFVTHFLNDSYRDGGRAASVWTSELIIFHLVRINLAFDVSECNV